MKIDIEALEREKEAAKNWFQDREHELEKVVEKREELRRAGEERIKVACTKLEVAIKNFEEATDHQKDLEKQMSRYQSAADSDMEHSVFWHNEELEARMNAGQHRAAADAWARRNEPGKASAEDREAITWENRANDYCYKSERDRIQAENEYAVVRSLMEPHASAVKWVESCREASDAAKDNLAQVTSSVQAINEDWDIHLSDAKQIYDNAKAAYVEAVQKVEQAKNAIGGYYDF